ncbi:hypothetical protein FOA52_015044 [Chlamydomonas sp. UWO 241]|nr:hypothetical protein FOA52_015044 [Chlamydomonas sp. UWO 241]
MHHGTAAHGAAAPALPGGEEILQGRCDICGDVSDAAIQECNLLSCTFAQCKDILYHQSCLDKFLRSNKLDKSRKTGFKCPRGCGKGSSFGGPCPGRIDKSHPIYPRNETKKLKALPIPVPAEPLKSKKEREREAAAVKAALPKPAAKVEEPKKEARVVKAAAPVPVKKAPEPVPPGPSKQQLMMQQLQEAKAAARRDLGLESRSGGGGMASGSGSSSSLVSKLAPAPAAPTVAWAKAGVSTSVAHTVAAPEPAGVHTLAMHPQLQQLFSTTSKPAAKAPPAAVVAAAAPVALPLASQAHFPPVAPVVSRAPTPAAAAPPAAADPHAAVPPPPPPPRRITLDALSGAPSSSAGGASGLPIGMEYCEDPCEDPSKMTKAQRKNLKRAERKKKVATEGDGSGGGGDGGSHDGDDDGPDAEALQLERAERDTIMEEMFVSALVCRKALRVLTQLQRLAFSEWQASAAVQRYGNDLPGCVAWLLEQEELGVEELAARRGEPGCAPCLPVVDISDELARLAEVQAGLALGTDSLHHAVIEASGDVPTAIEMLLDQARASPAITRRQSGTGIAPGSGLGGSLGGGWSGLGGSGVGLSSLAGLSDALSAADAAVDAGRPGSSASLSNGGASSSFAGMFSGMGGGLGSAASVDAAQASSPWAFTSPGVGVGGLGASANSNTSQTSGLTFHDWAGAGAVVDSPTPLLGRSRLFGSYAQGSS